MQTISLARSHSHTIPLGPLALIVSKHYYGVLSKSLEHLDIDRYYAVLYYLQDVKKCSQQQICNALAIDKTAMVKVMNYLIRTGYVQRKVNPRDRREQFVSLTPHGKKETKQIALTFRMLDKAAFTGVSKKEKDIFDKTVGKLLDNLRSQPSNDLFFNYKKTRPVTGAGKKK